MKKNQNPSEPTKIGRRGVLVIPAPMRKRLGLEEGSLVVMEEQEEGVLIRPAVAVPVEVYSPARKAEFLLNNAVDEMDYKAAREAVRALGLDPDSINHDLPGGRKRRSAQDH